MTGNPIDVSANTGTEVFKYPGDADPPSVTTTVANALVIAVGNAWVGWQPGGATTPAGYTFHEGNVTTNNIGIASKLVAAAGAENPGKFSNTAPNSYAAVEPVGAAQNDIVFMMVAMESVLTGFTGPMGWNLLYTSTNTNSTTRLYWIRRGASAPMYTITWDYPTSVNYIEVSVTAWSGAVTSGSPIDVSSANAPTQRDPANPDCPSVTTTVANTLVIAFGQGWRGWDTGGATPPAGYILREGTVYTNDIGIASKLKVAAGAEDPAAFGNQFINLMDVAEFTVALKPPAEIRVRHRVIND